MAEYIKREDAIKVVNGQSVLTMSRKRIIDQINVIPAADMAPVVHGRWVKNKLLSNDFYDAESCDRCGELVSWFGKLPDYCPNCGAKMDL